MVRRPKVTIKKPPGPEMDPSIPARIGRLARAGAPEALRLAHDLLMRAEVFGGVSREEALRTVDAVLAEMRKARRSEARGAETGDG